MASPEQKYRIIEKLDSGGMAEIYRGEVESIQGFKKPIAIKRVLPHLTQNTKFVSMFLDEARLSLYLNHANIVQVFDIGRADNTFFIVMEYVDGLNLRSLTDGLKRQGRRLEVAQALFIMMEVCKGLGYAHDMTDPETGDPLGIVHRDISPPNILLSKAGEVKLVDFGLAKAAIQLEDTEPGVVKGKFSYLSPEAASARDVDHRADIFSCGIILFEMLTGRRLFYGDNDFQTVELVRQAKVPPMAALNTDVSPELEQIVRRCLARHPDARYQTAHEMQEQLANYLFGRGLKVTNRDVALLVRQTLAEHRATAPPPVKASNLLDELIQEELVKFTSLDDLSMEQPVGERPVAPDELDGGSAPLDPRDFIDTRAWSDELNSAEIRGLDDDEETDREARRINDLAPLEEMLDERTPALASPPHLDLDRAPRPRRSGRYRGLAITLLLLAAIVVAAFVVLQHLGLLGGPDLEDNQDVVQPE